MREDETLSDEGVKNDNPGFQHQGCFCLLGFLMVLFYFLFLNIIIWFLIFFQKIIDYCVLSNVGDIVLQLVFQASVVVVGVCGVGVAEFRRRTVGVVLVYGVFGLFRVLSVLKIVRSSIRYFSKGFFPRAFF